VTLIVGPSGSGKSTLTKLLQGFYMPSEGRIVMDGRDHSTQYANEVRRMFGIVPQETVLFSGSVFDNLTAGNAMSNFDQVVYACKLAEIHDVIEALPQGYQTLLGERGAGLSGGQKQRIAIARALLKGPRVLILDEAVSNLDPETAEQFAATIQKLKGQITILFITHQVPRGLVPDAVIRLGGPANTGSELVVQEVDGA
jgi:subfamily B ATP-binding cassette protein HlyB/CyaB